MSRSGIRARTALAVFFLLVLAARLCHTAVLWVEECYPAAAAIQVLHGRSLYRDVWFDKPPLSALVYLLWGAEAGIPLRLAGAVFVAAACWLAFRFAREIWTEREGFAAACLLGFFLTFGVPAAVIPLAPDLLLVVPQLAAVWLAWRGRPFWSGFAAGVGLLVNSKAVLVLAACAVWQWRSMPALLCGFVLPNAVACGWMYLNGSLAQYWGQVWEWGFVYSRDTFLEHPLRTGALRTANWAGFHSALILGATAALRTFRDRWRWLCWIALATAGIVAGWRFFPRYYFLLLPALAVLGARGFVSNRFVRVAMLALMLIPLARFGPRYVLLAAGRYTTWSDLALNLDSAAAARLVSKNARAGDTLLVWGYRPDVFVYTRMPAGSPFLDSQPLTGVIADRHLADSRPSFPDLASRNRTLLTQTSPTFIADGLGPMNPSLAITAYPELRDWMRRNRYAEIGRTPDTIVYAIFSEPRP
jgi:hypothetical protein